jgi:adenylosuccinate synthase
MAHLAHVRERVRASLEGVREAAERASGGVGELAVFDDGVVAERWVEATRAFVARVRIVGDDVVAVALAGGERVIFEGAQGVLLDEDWGFHPYTTWSRCTFANARELLERVCPGEPLFRLGVARIYAHRHGPGPLPTESAELAASLDEPHNLRGPWQGPFRVGWPDLVLARYAFAATGGIDGLALTHLDGLQRVTDWRLADSYEDGRIIALPLDPPNDFSRREESTRKQMEARPRLVQVRSAAIEEALRSAYGAPVVLRSTGPTHCDVKAAG